LRRVLEMPRLDLFCLARRSRLFVERWHDPTVIADRLFADILSSLKT
jgi:hypothetical protein